MKKKDLPGRYFKITGGIYSITCSETEDVYIGKSKNLNQRWCQHRNDFRKGKHNNPHLQALHDLYGTKSLTMTLVELVEDEGSLETREAFWTKEKEANLNVTNTKLSANSIVELHDDLLTLEKKDVAIKYNISIKYLNEIIRGDKWKQAIYLWSPYQPFQS